jgi:outer membrane protein OmpA-like peptidoglycan-associated protein
VPGERERARSGDPEPPARLSAGPRHDTSDEQSSADGDVRLPLLLSAGNAAVARLVQRYAAGPQDAADDLAARLSVEAGRGQPLPAPVQQEMEAGSGASLDGVQIHTGSAADSLARDLGARALTTGQDIYFRSGAYSPSSEDGYRLLAHEVTHTIQQRSGEVSASGFAPGVAVSHPDDTHERAAEAAAGALLRARGGPSPSTAGPPAGLSWSASGQVHTVQRFSGYEHESLGDVTGAVIDLGGGITLTWGQVVAIAGDEIGSVEDLQQMVQTEAGRRQIRAALEHDEVRKPITSALPAATDDERKKQKETYIDLAMRNVSHFAAGGTALDTWRSHHARALQAALSAGLSGNAADFEQAQLLEAFGQHFLTDMFSGGHVRTPRKEIMDFHAALAPTMAAAFVANLRQRIEDYLVSQIMLQIGTGIGPPSMQAPPLLGVPSIRGDFSQGKAREEVHATVDAELTKALAQVGGMPGLSEKFGLALAGAVSGALHDRDGRQGVIVSSEDHPQPWLAKGDSRLDESPSGGQTQTGSVSRDQAEKAVLAAREQLLAARSAGERETVIARVAPADPPTALIVHFAFASAALDGAQADVNAAGAYLHIHLDSQVALTGHTDPIGTEGSNMSLGQRRADAVKAGLVAGGAQPDQVATASLGETSLVTQDPKRYRENRRVEFAWQSRPVPGNPAALDMCVDPIRERAQQVIDSFGPPYAAVERYIPHEAPFMNDPLPEWRWGKMAPEIIAEVDRWIKDMVGSPVRELVSAVPETMMAHGFTFTVHNLAQQVADELLQAPTQTIGRLIGQPAG